MHIGKRHDYLGMILDFTTPGVLEIDMSEYIQVILQDTPANIRGTSMVPAAKHLFTTHPDAPKISLQAQEIFHHLTMQLMYLSQRGRTDIRTAVEFLSSRVANPDQDDYMKLGKVVKYLENTIHLTLRLQADETNLLQWWVDAAYATHPDMKGHTGTTFTMGHGSIYSNSLKQKLVARSSTEAELVGVHDILPQILWTHNFLMSQGYPVQKNVVYQDNMSAMLLENNGHKSSTKRTKHIELRYFFIHDQVQQDKVLIKHCPTLNMRADFFTKPEQGILFYRLRDLIMNFAPESPYHSSHRSVLQDTDEGHNKSNDNPVNSADEAKTSSGTCIRTRMTGTPTGITNNSNQDGVLKQQDAFITTKTGTRRRRETTKGWELLVQWKDDGTNWIALKDIKESYPAQVAEYAVSSRISEEPAFAWWSPLVLKKRNRIIAKTKSKYWLRTHKFGIEIPKSVLQAQHIDAKCGNTLWWDAICKEMKNVMPAFKVFEGDVHQLPSGFQEIKCHMIFDVKIGENFRRKARMSTFHG